MKNYLITCSLIFISFLKTHSQSLNGGAETKEGEKSKFLLTKGYSHKGQLFFYWGYNRAIFSRSDLHVMGPEYDFTLFDISAHDRPSPFSVKLYFGPTTFTIPQYNYRIGYYLNDHFSISFGQDHMKYVMDQDQQVLLSGVISPEASESYAGNYLDSSITVTQDFLKFEHTDGLNLLSLDFEFTYHLFSLLKQKIQIGLNSGVGGSLMVPRTDVRVFGDGLNNNFHLAGYAMTAKIGPQVEFFRLFFLRAQTKAGYVNLPSILIKNEAPQRAAQDFSFAEFYVVWGMQFYVGKKKQ